MKRLLLSVSMLALAAGSVGVIDAVAQAVNAPASRNVAVLDRPRPDYDAVGVRAGAFTLRPTLDVAVESSDNIFYTNTNKQSDVIVSLRPRVDIDSNWSRHMLRATLDADTNAHQDFDSEDRTNFGAAAETRIDISPDFNVGALAGYRQFSEPRSSLDARSVAGEQVEVETQNVGVYATYTLNRLRLGARAERVSLDAKNVRTPGGALIRQDQRDRDVSIVGLRADYALTPDTRVFGQVSINSREYDLRRPPAVAEDPNSNGREALVGISTDLTNLIRGEFSAGYFSQDYKSARVGTVEGFAARGRVQWFPTQLTTVTFNAERGVEEIDIGTSNSAIASRVGARIDHEVRRNIIVSGRISNGNYDYQGIALEEDRFDAGLEARYLLNRRAEVAATYRYERADQSGVAVGARDFKTNTFGVSLRLKL